MKSKNVGALVLIILGIAFLMRNLNLLPRLKVVWPAILIIAGIAALYQASDSAKSRGHSSGEVIAEMDGTSPVFKALVAIPALIIALVVGLFILGILGPFFLLFLLFIPVLLFIKLGWFFLRLLLPILFIASPLLLIILVLALIF